MGIDINIYNNDSPQSNVKYVYLQERNGSTPYPGTNGNWWINGKDTGMRAVPYSKNDEVDMEKLKKSLLEQLDLQSMLETTVLSTKADKIHKHIVSDITDLETISHDTINNILGE